MERISTHQIETKSRDFFRSWIDDYYENGDSLFRDISERDYGIDGIVELFDKGIPSGELALIQIKGSSQPVQKLQREEAFSCTISTSNARYALQMNVPVILVYVVISAPQNIYFLNLNSTIEHIDNEKINSQASLNVHIPFHNNTSTNGDLFFNIIRSFFENKIDNSAQRS